MAQLYFFLCMPPSVSGETISVPSASLDNKTASLLEQLVSDSWSRINNLQSHGRMKSHFFTT